MKAINIKTPHIQHIMAGKKTLEIRSWNTHYRGDVLLVCSRSPASDWAGMAVGIVRIEDVRLMREEDTGAACINFIPDHFAWILRDVRPIVQFAVRGKLSFYEVRMP